MTPFRWVTLGVVLVLTGAMFLAPAGEGAEAATRELVGQQEKQKQIQEETERLLRRIETMVRVLEYNRLGASGQKALLDDVAKTLAGVSREQMADLIVALEKAGKATGQARTSALTKANGHHEKIVLELKGLLAKFDAVRDLDQTAERLEKLSRDEVEQALTTNQLIYEAEQTNLVNRRDDPAHRRAERAASEQGFSRKDFTDLLVQVGDLPSKLPQEQKERVARFAQAVQTRKIAHLYETILEHLRQSAYAQQRDKAWAKAAAHQWGLAGDLVDLARLVRPAPERLALLRELNRGLIQRIEEQAILVEDTRTPPALEGGDVQKDEGVERRVDEGRGFMERRGGGMRLGFGMRREEIATPADPRVVHGKQMGDRQGWVEHETRVIRGNMAATLVELSAKLVPVEERMRDAQDELRKQMPAPEITPVQEEALAGLQAVQKEIERLLVEEERTRNDPLANLKDALARVEQILREEKELLEKTNEANRDRRSEKLPPNAAKQSDLARQTEAVKRDAQAAKQEAKQALAKAAREMDKATNALRSREGKESEARQQEAINQLEQAKEALAEQIKEMEQRREEIAKLEEAREKLAELIKQEQAIAEKAAEMADRTKAPESEKLAQKQAEVTPPTKELSQSLKESAPEASKKVEAGAKAMEAAKDRLDKAQPKPAAKKAEEAVSNLKDAEKALEKALEQKRAEEAAAQAMQENIDAEQAAQQIAKALEQAQMAQKAAEQAEMQQARDLAKMQKQVADQSPKVKAPDAKRPASDAAEALKRGDLRKAMQDQKESLGKLQQAAQKEGKSGEKGEKGEGSGEPSQAKNAQQLAEAQQRLMDATEQMARSQAATQAAMSALGQAKANAPQAVQGQLGKANQQLGKAQQSLQKGQPGSAGEAQGKAADQLAQALAALNQAQAMAQPGQPGEGMPPGEGQGKEPGKGKGQPKQPGQQPGNQPGRAQEQNPQRAMGDRITDGQGSNDKGAAGDTRGSGLFINLPPRQREMLRQALTEKLPAEYAAMIQQYFVNIAKGKPAPTKK